jgi:hypothetical protein
MRSQRLAGMRRRGSGKGAQRVGFLFGMAGDGGGRQAQGRRPARARTGPARARVRGPRLQRLRRRQRLQQAVNGASRALVVLAAADSDTESIVPQQGMTEATRAQQSHRSRGAPSTVCSRSGYLPALLLFCAAALLLSSSPGQTALPFAPRCVPCATPAGCLRAPCSFC